MNRRLSASLAALVAASVLAACSSAVKLEDPAPTDDRGAAAGSAGMGGTAGGAGTVPVPGSDRPIAQVNVEPKDPLNDPASPLAKRSIYFDFDSFTIRDEFRSTVDAHAKYLLSNRTRRVVIQGNTDERGSREYNLALGQKRSEAVRRALTALGVADGQIEAVSLGEEKPRATGSDEAAFAENRRADLVYQ